MAYVYRHIRLDKNEPFYIGVGKRGKNYSRAYAQDGRNPIWYKIVAKTEYEVEIMIDDISYDEALEKEKEFISLYGRIKDGGILANITLGGGGQLGVSRAAWNKGKSPKPESIEKQRNKLKGKLAGEKHPFFGKHHTPESNLKNSLSNLGRIPWNKDKKMSKDEIDKSGLLAGKNKKAVIQYDINMNFIAEFESATEASIKTGFRKSSICKCCSGFQKSPYRGYYWKNKNGGY